MSAVCRPNVKGIEPSLIKTRSSAFAVIADRTAYDVHGLAANRCLDSGIAVVSMSIYLFTVSN